MQKKGELTLQFLIGLILALIVLFVVVWFFRDQIITFITTITGAGQDLSRGVDQNIEQLLN